MFYRSQDFSDKTSSRRVDETCIAEGKEAPCDQLSASGLFGGPEALWQPGDPVSFAGNQHQPSRPGAFSWAWVEVGESHSRLPCMLTTARLLCHTTSRYWSYSPALCWWPGVSAPIDTFCPSVTCCFGVEPQQLFEAELPFSSCSGGVMMLVCLPSSTENVSRRNKTKVPCTSGL